LSPFSGKMNLILTWKYVFSVQMFDQCFDVTQDDYRIILFEGSESSKSGTTLKHHLNLIDEPHRPSTSFSVCILDGASLSVSATGTSRKTTKSRISWQNFAITTARWWILMIQDRRPPQGLLTS
jgi:hypothetical protein